MMSFDGIDLKPRKEDFLDIKNKICDAIVSLNKIREMANSKTDTVYRIELMMLDEILRSVLTRFKGITYLLDDDCNTIENKDSEIS